MHQRLQLIVLIVHDRKREWCIAAYICSVYVRIVNAGRYNAIKWAEWTARWSREKLCLNQFKTVATPFANPARAALFTPSLLLQPHALLVRPPLYRRSQRDATRLPCVRYARMARMQFVRHSRTRSIYAAAAAAAYYLLCVSSLAFYMRPYIWF